MKERPYEDFVNGDKHVILQIIKVIVFVPCSIIMMLVYPIFEGLHYIAKMCISILVRALYDSNKR